MKIMIEACVYNRYKDVVISIDGDGPILNILVSKKGKDNKIYVGDGLTIDTDSIIKEADGGLFVRG